MRVFLKGLLVVFFFSEASTLSLMRNIKIIHLVNDEDLMPTALLYRHWEKLLKNECDDW